MKELNEGNVDIICKMYIKIQKDSSKLIDKFEEKAWQDANLEHYGVIDTGWISEKFVLSALENKIIVGVCKFEFKAGVVYLDVLIVGKDHQSKGVGKLLHQKMEEMVVKLGAHKIYLHTGFDWKARKFYESLGYKLSADLPNFYLKKHFLEYTKNL